MCIRDRLSLAFGPEVFAQFLDGAAAEDKLSLNKNIKENPEMLDALIGVYAVSYTHLYGRGDLYGNRKSPL